MSPTPVGPDIGAEKPEEITLDDLRHKALRMREDVRDETRELIAERRVQLVTGAIVGVLVVVSVAYFVGMGMGRRSVPLPPV